MEQEQFQEVDFNVNYVTNGLHTLLLIRDPWKITGTIHKERKVFKFQVFARKILLNNTYIYSEFIRIKTYSRVNFARKILLINIYIYIYIYFLKANSYK